MIACPWHIGILVPARNEEELLPRCLHSIAAACAALPAGITFDVIVGVDSSTDLTREIAERMLFGYGIAVTTQARAVGRVRTLAAHTALLRYAGPLQRCWLANTDADCCVPKIGCSINSLLPPKVWKRLLGLSMSILSASTSQVSTCNFVVRT